MLPALTRNVRLGLAAVLVLLVALFSMDAAYGQHDGKSPFGPGGPGNGSTGNNPFEHTYRCMKCGATFTSSAIGGPSHCPSCGVKFVNGGFDPLGGPGPAGSRAATARGVGAAVVVIVVLLGVVGLVVPNSSR